MKKKTLKKKGFTFVEIMVVVAVLSLLTLISLPLIKNMRISANEAKAQANIKTLADVLESYWIANNTYLVTLASLADNNQPSSPPYLDKSWTNDASKGGKSGYLYSIDTSKTNKYAYSLKAEPVETGKTGNRTFTLDHSGEIVLAKAENPPDGEFRCPAEYLTCPDGKIIMVKDAQCKATGTTCPACTSDVKEPCPALKKQITTYKCVNGTLIPFQSCGVLSDALTAPVGEGGTLPGGEIK